MRKSGSWICAVTEKGDLFCGKPVAAMWVFPYVYRQIIREQVTVTECRTYTHETYELFTVINMFDNVDCILTILFGQCKTFCVLFTSDHQHGLIICVEKYVYNSHL